MAPTRPRWLTRSPDRRGRGKSPWSIRNFRWSISTVLLLAFLVVALVVVACSVIGGYVIDDVAGPPYGAFNLAALALSVRVALRRSLDARTRLGWWLIAASLVILFVASLMYAIASEEVDASAYPLLADWVRLLWGPVMLAGLLTMPTRSRSAESHTKMALDIGMVLVGGGMLIWHLLLGPVVLEQQRLSVTFLALAYPVLDLALIGAATIILFRTAASSARGPLLLLAASTSVMVTGDIYLGYLRVQSNTENFGWQFLAWIGSCLLIAMAAAEQHRLSGDHRVDVELHSAFRPVPRLPYAAVILGYGLLITVAVGLPLYPYGGLVIGAVAMTALVVGRQILALRENYHLVVTDNLTGLANRALLRDRLTRAMQRSRRTGQPVAVLQIDLNRFKEINDTLGHEAGDEMLVAFARILEGSVRRMDTVARLGGDEFAVVLHGDDAAAAARTVSERLQEATTTPVIIAGQPMHASASIGMAVSEPGGDTVNELLHRADIAMYTAKRERVDGSPPLNASPDPAGHTP